MYSYQLEIIEIFFLSVFCIGYRFFSGVYIVMDKQPNEAMCNIITLFVLLFVAQCVCV